MKRVTWLQDFLTELQRDRTLRSSEVFNCFANITDKAQFDRKAKELAKAKGPRIIEEIKLLNADSAVGVNEHKDQIARNIGYYTQACPSLYTKLIQANEDTTKIIRLLSDAFARNAAIYKDLAIAHVAIEVITRINSLELRINRFV
jgi:hypothetical protein